MKKLLLLMLTLGMSSLSFGMLPTKKSTEIELIFSVGECLFAKGLHQHSLPFLIRGLLAAHKDLVHGYLFRESLVDLIQGIKTESELRDCLAAISSYTFPEALLKTQNLCATLLCARLDEEFPDHDTENQDSYNKAWKGLQRNVVRAAGRNPDKIEELRRALELSLKV